MAREFIDLDHAGVWLDIDRDEGQQAAIVRAVVYENEDAREYASQIAYRLGVPATFEPKPEDVM
jgi:hypothetical protein